MLVNIGGPDQQTRSQLATLLRALRSYEPKVVGLDAYFEFRVDTANARLVAAMRALPQLVTGVKLDSTAAGWRTTRSDQQLVPGTIGYLNFMGDNPLTSTIRHFRPFVHQSDSTYRSWSACVVSKYSAAAYQALRARHAPTAPELEEIRYWGSVNQFQHYEAAELLNGLVPADSLRGKIVLLGVMGEQAAAPPTSLEDLHFTPLNQESLGRSQPDMYGVVIQANIISMLLRQDYLTATHWTVNWLLALLVCFSFCLVSLYWEKRSPIGYALWSTPLSVGFQLVLGIVFFFLVVELYKKANIHLDPTPTFLALALVGYVLAWFNVLAKGYKQSMATGRRYAAQYRKRLQLR